MHAVGRESFEYVAGPQEQIGHRHHSRSYGESAERPIPLNLRQSREPERGRNDERGNQLYEGTVTEAVTEPPAPPQSIDARERDEGEQHTDCHPPRARTTQSDN